MEEIIQAIWSSLPDSWLVYVTAVVAMCAAICTVLPAPKEDGSKVYKVFYQAMQWIALNIGKARNGGTR